MTISRRSLLLAFVCALPVSAVAFSASVAAEPKVHRVVIENMRFGAMPAGIKKGDVILWVNRDPVPHTATARDESFDVNLPAGTSRRMRVDAPGRRRIYCRFHPAMIAVLEVSA